MINKDMANLYLDLSCDVIWVFNSAFGRLPEVENEEKWVLDHLSQIDAELKSITEEIPMNSMFRKNLQERFVKRSVEAKVQFDLLHYLEGEVVKYASFKKARKKAISVTNNLLFVLVRLLGDLHYSVQTKKA
jgi:uroporphyrinogen-III decarboxylase